MSENLKKMLAHQKSREDAEAKSLMKSLWDGKDQKTLIAYELDKFLREEMPNLEPLQRLHLYQLSDDLRRKFTIRLIEKGLIKV
jgi:hypothetical protein